MKDSRAAAQRLFGYISCRAVCEWTRSARSDRARTARSCISRCANAGIVGLASSQTIAAGRTAAYRIRHRLRSHALDAFDTQASDYLLKPVDDVRLKHALSRVRRELQQHALVARHEQMMKT